MSNNKEIRCNICSKIINLAKFQEHLISEHNITFLKYIKECRSCYEQE